MICPHAESCYLARNYRTRVGSRGYQEMDVIKKIGGCYICIITDDTSERRRQAELMEVDCMHLRTLNILEKIARGLEGKK